MNFSQLLRAGLCGLLLLLGGVLSARGQEVPISEADFKRLDTFEGHELEKADTVFAKREYRAALAEYDAFLKQFPKSPALAYAVFRKARCLQLDNKRFEAVKQYNEVLDYFPNAVDYAGAALFFIGQCHAQNGELALAMKAWKEMADDTDYRKHFLAAGALNQLADNLSKQNKKSEANDYYKQVVMDFRNSNRDASTYAFNKVLEYYILINPNEPKLREFCVAIKAFGKDEQYWAHVRGVIRSVLGAPEEQRSRVCRYWVGVMEKLFPSWDDFQKDVADFALVYEGDTKKWITRLDRLFDANQKDGDFDRILRFMGYYQGMKNKVLDYYNKLTFAKMSNPQIIAVMKFLMDNSNFVEMGRNVYNHIKQDALSDNDRYGLERYFWNKDAQLVIRICETFEDKTLGRMEMLRFYHRSRNFAKGMPLADEMSKVPEFAKETLWMRAEMLHWQGKWPEAIVAYQACDNPPTNLWRIVDCHLGNNKRESAIAQLREIENFFEAQGQAPPAAMRIATIYRDTGDKDKYIACLRGIMKKYPKSGESNTAHIELERLGVKIGGTVDAE